MRNLFLPVFACLALSGCALPLLQAAGAGMLSPPTCAAGTACPQGLSGVMGIGRAIPSVAGMPTGLASRMGNGMFGGIGSTLQTLAGVASTEPSGSK